MAVHVLVADNTASSERDNFSLLTGLDLSEALRVLKNLSL